MLHAGMVHTSERMRGRTASHAARRHGACQHGSFQHGTVDKKESVFSLGGGGRREVWMQSVKINGVVSNPYYNVLCKGLQSLGFAGKRILQPAWLFMRFTDFTENSSSPGSRVRTQETLPVHKRGQV